MSVNRIVHRTGAANLGTVQEQLGRQDNVLPHVSQSFSDNALVVSGAGQVRAVDLRRIKKRTAMPVGILNRLNTVCLRGNLAVTVGKGHAAHANRRYSQFSNFSCFHAASPPVWALFKKFVM